MRALVLLIAVLLAPLSVSPLDIPASPLVPADEIVLTAAADATLLSASATTNFGDNPYLFASYSLSDEIAPDRGVFLVRFNLSGLPAEAEIDSAVLELYLNEVSGAESVSIGAYFVNTAWDESTVTWNTPVETETIGVNANVDTAQGYKSWDVSSFARIWAGGENKGVLLMGAFSAPNYTRGFFSREQGEFAPKLTISYHVPPPIGDLVMEEVVVDPNPAYAGETVAVTVTVRAEGELAYAVPVILLQDGERIAASAVDIPAGQSKAVTFEITVPALGLYTLEAIANPEGSLPEVSLENNRASQVLNIVFEKDPIWSKADLALSQFTLSPDRAAQGAEVAVSAVVMNGARPDLVSVPIVLLIDGVVVDEQMTPGLPSGASAELTLHWGSATPGRHYARLMADPEHTLVERRVDNNMAGDWLRVDGAPAPRPDVEVSAIGLNPRDPQPSDDANIEIELYNAGFVPVADLPVQVLLDGHPLADAIASQLAPGARTTLVVPWRAVGAGSHVLTVRLDPEGRLDLDSIQREWTFIAIVGTLNFQPSVYATASSYQLGALWEFIGPRPMMAGTSIANGRMDGIAISEQDSNVMMLGSVGGGAWRTENGGSAWTAVTSYLPTPEFMRVAIDPENDEIAYVFSGAGYIYKSNNGGVNWSRFTGPPLPMGDRIHQVLLRYEQANTLNIFVASTNGLWVWRGSPNADAAPAAEWRRVWQQTRFANANAHDDVTSFLITPESQPLVYLSVDHDSVYRAMLADVLAAAAQQTAVNWTALDAGLPLADLAYVHLGNSAAVPERVFAAVVRSAECATKVAPTIEIYRRDRNASTWTFAGRPTDTARKPNACGIQYNAFLRVHPSKPDILLIGGVSGWRSADGGQNWANITNVHVDFKDAMFDPQDDSVIFFTSDGGIYRCAQDGTQCAPLNDDLETAMFYDISVEGSNNRLVIGGTQDNGTLRYDSPSLTWKEIHGGDGRYTAIHPTNNDIMYVQEQYADSTDNSINGGDTFVDANTGLPTWEQFSGDPYLVMHKGKPDTLLIAADMSGHAQVYRTTTSGTTWLPIGPDPATTRGGVLRIVIDAANDRYYAGTLGEIWAVAASQAGAGPWTRIYEHPTLEWVRELLVDPDNPDVLYATFGGAGAARVVELTHTGAAWPGTWEPDAIAEGLSVDLRLNGGPSDAIRGLVLEPNPGAATVLYVGTDRGIYQGRRDRGQVTWNWAPDYCGMPVAYISDLELHDSGTWMAAATYGRGAYVRLTGQTINTPDAYDTPTRNDTLVQAKTLPAITKTWYLHPGLTVSDLNMDRPGDVDFFTVQMPPGSADDCLAADDPGLGKPGVYQCALSITAHAPDTPDPFEFRLYQPDGSVLKTTKAQVSALSYTLERPYDIFPSGQFTFSVRSLTGCRSTYDLSLAYSRSYMAIDLPELFYDPPLTKIIVPELRAFPWLFPADPELIYRGFLGSGDPLPEQRAFFYWPGAIPFRADLSIEGGKDLHATLYDSRGEALAEAELLPHAAGGTGATTQRRVAVDELPAGWYALGFHDGAFPTYFSVQFNTPDARVMLPLIER